MTAQAHRPLRLLVPLCDLEAQRLLTLSRVDFALHVRLAYLVSKHVVLSPSFVLESAPTEELFSANQELLRHRATLLSMHDETPTDFVRRKIAIYGVLPNLQAAYPGLFRATPPLPLLEMAYPIQRPDRIEARLADLWSRQLDSRSATSLRSEIIATLGSSHGRRLLTPLRRIPLQRGNLPFTWEVVELLVAPHLEHLSDDTASALRRNLRLRLLALYCQALASLADADVVAFSDYGAVHLDDRGSDSVARPVSIEAFRGTLSALRVVEVVAHMPDWQLLELKESGPFLGFLESYFQCLRRCATHDEVVEEVVRELEFEREALARNCLHAVAAARAARTGDLVRSVAEAVSRSDIAKWDVLDHPALVDEFGRVPLLRFQAFIVDRYAKRCRARRRRLETALKQTGRSRPVELPAAKEGLWPVRRVTLLMVSANPVDTDRLGLDEEAREIHQKIRAAEFHDSIELVTRWAARADDMLQALNETRPAIVHFSGHGSADGRVLLVGSNRKAVSVSPEALSSLFHAFEDSVRVVFLNACFSASQAQAITTHIECTVGMSTAVGDRAAIVFAAAFYRAIGFGWSVADAFRQGKAALRLEGVEDEEETPQLLVRSGVDPFRVFPLSATGERS